MQRCPRPEQSEQCAPEQATDIPHRTAASSDSTTRQGYASLDELVKVLGVSESTVRRDLEALDLAGSIKRTHGGAVYTGEVRSMPAFDERTETAAAEKRAIGLAAAALLQDGDTVLLDGGTTTLEVARRSSADACRL